MAQCRLPFSFNILSKLSPGQRPPALHGPRKRPRLEQKDGGANAPALRIPPDNWQIHHPALDIGNQSGREDGSSTSLPLVSLPRPARIADPGVGQPQAISPPKADGERTPTLTEGNPDSGTFTGGVRIWLKGMDFPALLPLFARFGAAVVPTVRT